MAISARVVGQWLGVAADALALSTVADLEEVGITEVAAVSIAGFFDNLDDVENVELKPEPEPELEPEMETEPHVEPQVKLQVEPEPAPAPEPEPDPDPDPEPPAEHKPADPVVEVLMGLGLLQHLTACRVHEMDLGARH